MQLQNLARNSVHFSGVWMVLKQLICVLILFRLVIYLSIEDADPNIPWQLIACGISRRHRV